MSTTKRLVQRETQPSDGNTGACEYIQKVLRTRLITRSRLQSLVEEARQNLVRSDVSTSGCQFQGANGPWREGDVALGGRASLIEQSSKHVRSENAKVRAELLIRGDNREQKVFGPDVIRIDTARFLDRGDHDGAGSFVEALEQFYAPPASSSSRRSRLCAA